MRKMANFLSSFGYSSTAEENFWRGENNLEQEIAFIVSCGDGDITCRVICNGG